MSEPGERFSESDLEPSAADRAAERRSLVERFAATVAVIAAGLWVGGMIALGACAAPFVFRLTPSPFSGNAMAAAFGRFDQIAIGASAVILGAEVARTWAARRRARSTAARARRFLAMLAAAFAVYGGLVLTPGISALHNGGAQRGVGSEGEALERLHKRAELAGKTEVGLGLALIVLHVLTLGARRPDEDDDEALAPLPPGP